MIWRGTALTRPVPVACACPARAAAASGARRTSASTNRRWVPRAVPRQAMAGMDLAGPALRRAAAPCAGARAGLARRRVRTIAAVVVGGAVVHDEDLDGDARAGAGPRRGPAPMLGRFVARRDRGSRPGRRRAAAGGGVRPQDREIHEREHGRQGRERARRTVPSAVMRPRGPRAQGSKRRPRQAA